MSKNLIPGLILTYLTQIWNPRFFLQLLPLLVIRHSSKLSSYAIQRKINAANLRKWQLIKFWTRFWPVSPKFGPQKVLGGVLPILVVRHCSSYAIQRKTSKPNLRKWKKKLILGMILACFGPNLVTKTFFRGFTSTRCQTLLQTVTEYNFKEN